MDRRHALTAFLGRLRWAWPWLVLAVLGWLGWRELREIDLSIVRSILSDTDPVLMLVLLCATALNLCVFGLYDVVALGPLSKAPAPGERWGVGVVSFAWSNFLTIGPLAGPALRLWLYKPLGVDGARSRSALGAIMVAFWLTLLALCAAASLPLPVMASSVGTRAALAALLLALAAALLHASRRSGWAPGFLRRWEGNPSVLVLVSAIDWILAWLVFHLALCGTLGTVDLSTSLSTFFAGQLIGLVSFVPGGLGPADAWWLIALGSLSGSHGRVLAALLVYRAVYYVLPWAFATLLLAGRLIRTGRRTGSLVRSAIASYGFLCGVVLLASAATPALAARAAFLREMVPPGLVEISHGLSIVLGFLLLVISRGLARGYRASHRLALALFLAGALTTFLKGLDWEEALLALAAVAMLVVFHRSFAREGRMRPPVEFVVSMGILAVVLFGAVGYGSLSDLPQSSVFLSRLEYFPHEERFLRGLFLLVSLSAVAALHFTLRAAPRDPLPDGAGLDGAMEEIRKHGSGTNPLLLASGDKAIFRETPPAVDSAGEGGPPPEGFIAYRTAGRFLVAYSDPVCPPGRERGLLAAFQEFAALLDREVILYQISASLIPVAHDLGFSFFKLGEEAIVDLRRFDLKGNKAKSWRHAVNSVEKLGGRLEIVEGDALRGLLPELREVSAEWLRDKHLAEKQFSIGRFDEKYLMRFPCAVVFTQSGRVAGFANVLEGPRGEEMSVDLMRYRSLPVGSGGLPGVMDYLLIKLMLHAKERGSARFNLGMAPLSNVGGERRARPFEKMAHFFFSHGQAWYNYEGLRRYKEKFDPLWEPRYMAHPRPWQWPAATASTAILIAGGWRALLFPKAETATILPASRPLHEAAGALTSYVKR